MLPEKSLKMGEKLDNNLFNLLNDAVYILGLNDKFLEVNDLACNRLGYTRHELLQLNLQNISASELSKEVLNNVAKLKKKKNLTFESIHVTKDGLKIPVEITANLIQYCEEPAILIISKNIEEHVITKKKLKKTKAKYRDLYENAPNAFFSINLSHIIVKCNAGAERLLGYSKSDLINKNIFEIFADTRNGIDKATQVFQDFLRGEEIQDEELQMKKKNGELVWISVSLRPIPSKQGRIIESLLMAINIEKRKKIEQLLKDSELKYREAYDRANFFKDVIIHDVHNVFQVIRSSGELYEYYKKNSQYLDKIEELFFMINQAVERGIKLVQNARKLSQLEESEIVIQSIDLYDILNASIKIMKKHSQEQQINIQIDAFSQNIKVRANELLQDVFENILVNSVKYNQNPTFDINIKISKIQKYEEHYIKIEFIDNGIGIPDFKKELIFEKGSKNKGGKGLGFGLSLVKKIIESYNGKIWVEDRVEGDYTKGSNFVLLIPEVY